MKNVKDIDNEEYEIYLKVKSELKNKKYLQIRNKLKRSIPMFIFFTTLILELVLCNIAGSEINKDQYWIICVAMMIAYASGMKITFDKD